MIQSFTVRSIDRRADADAHARVRISTNVQRKIGHNCFDAFAQLVDLRTFEAGNDRYKFIAGVTCQKIVFAQLTMDQARDLTQHAVADLVSERVVDQLEMIEVQHDYLERLSGTLGTRDFFLKTNVQTARVRQTSQRIR